MCTTFLATELVRDLTQDHDLIGYPRLVRLNPNIPWKTRGNGAICLRIGRGRGKPLPVGQLDGRPVVAYLRGDGDVSPEKIAERVATQVERWSDFEDSTTHPGFAVLTEPAPSTLYWRGVREVLTKEEVVRAVQASGFVRGYKNGRGVIGAVAAAAWRPRDRTYEVIAYRHRVRWGTRRDVDPLSVVEMDRSYLSTFNNYDYDNRRVVIAPHSPCPVLFGIRGSEPDDLLSAKDLIRGEAPDRWLLFETNQGTDDHVVRSRRMEPYRTIRFEGVVTHAARGLEGGHVLLAVNSIDVAAYEPSKQFRKVVRALVPGDRVEVVGAVRQKPPTLNLEKIRVVSLTEVVRKVSNPRCPGCGKHAKSIGRAAGFRCRRCHRRFPLGATPRAKTARRLDLRWHQPPTGSRRHVSKPLKRMGVDEPSLPRPSG
jgi:tRNA(Ile2)-agmatinylcytidine synthase